MDKTINTPIEIKECLRDEVLPELRQKEQYFSQKQIRDCLSERKIKFKPATLNRYLVDFVNDGMIFKAGRSWFSSIGTPFVLDVEPVREIIGLLTKGFPALEFSCWSTEQVKSYSQHMMNRFVSFAFVPRDAMRPIYETLRDSGWNAYLNPGQKEAKNLFEIKERTVVVRPRITKEPADQHFATIEKILVDFWLEARDLQITDVSECRKICLNVTIAGRISMSSLQTYAERRKLKLEALFPK